MAKSTGDRSTKQAGRDHKPSSALNRIDYPVREEPPGAKGRAIGVQLTIHRIEEVIALVRDEGRRHLDLRSVRFADPYGLLLLHLLACDEIEHSRPLHIVWPDRTPVGRWIHAMGLPAKHGRAPSGMSPNVRSALQPITPIEDEAGIIDLVNRFDARLAERYPLDDAPRRTLIRIMIELFQNIPQHSNATGEIVHPRGIAAMQDYRDALILAIADNGIGLRTSLSLRETDVVDSDADAIDAVVLRGLSRFADPGRGKELQRIFRMVRSWDGTIAVRSGSALLFHDPERGADIHDVAPFPGVQIALVIPQRIFGVGEVDEVPEDRFNEPNE